MQTLHITGTRRKIFTTAAKADLILLSNNDWNTATLIFTPHPHLIVNPIIWVIFFHMFNLQLRIKLRHHHLYYSCFFPISHSLRENSELKVLLLLAKAVFASCSHVRDKDTGITIHYFYYCTYFDLKRHLFKAQHAPVHPSVPPYTA